MDVHLISSRPCWAYQSAAIGRGQALMGDLKVPENLKEKNSNRIAIISTVKTYLGFFVLLILVVETSLGALAYKTDGQNQLIAIIGMVLVFLGLILVVSFFAYRKPEVLLQTMVSQQRSLEFAHKISGYWWQTLAPDEPCALSFVEISFRSSENSLRLDGWAYNREGGLVTYWETEAGFIDLSEKQIIYAWKRKRSSPNYSPYEGFGQISFREPIGQGQADGFFLDINFSDISSTKKFTTEYWRPEKNELSIMQARDKDQISRLIQEKLAGD